jgi:phage I-like protein
LKAQIAALTAGASAAPVANASEVVASGNNDFHANLDNLWREDPRKAMQTELMMALNWQDQVNNAVDTQLEMMGAKHKDFGDYSADVRRYIRKLPVEQRAKPGIAEAAFFMVKGQKADTLVQTEAARLLQRAKAGDAVQSIAGGTSSGGGAQVSGQLSPEEKSAAAALGISETEYLKYRK